ncbi:hypothetical protein [Catalinimonas alkaloidigena]|nr:hypothetical protein [Catalinimonas alkaloidigena]
MERPFSPSYTRNSAGDSFSSAQKVAQLNQWLESCAAEQHANRRLTPEELAQCPTELVVAYLKHQHYVFIKKRLPYLNYLVRNLHGHLSAAVQDLQFIFPIFLHDFIEHVYQEEDTLFARVLALENKQLDATLPSLADMARHHAHDDILRGVREMTHRYRIGKDVDLSEHVLLTALRLIDEEMAQHNRIEDEVLLPRAVALEAQLRLAE